MKAEKRHQLQRNALADGVGRLLQGMKSAPTTRSTLAWVFVILTVGTVVVWQYGAFATQAHYSALWTQVDSASRDLASGGEKLRQLGEENRDSLPGRSARKAPPRRHPRGREPV